MSKFWEEPNSPVPNRTSVNGEGKARMALIDGVDTGSDGSDRSLVARSLQGDAEAFARLYARYRPSLYHVCLRRLRDPSLAEDVVHEAFERAFNHLDSFDTSRRIFPWLVTIATNACVDVLRARAKLDLVAEHESNDEVVLDLDHPHDDTTARAVIDSEERKRLGVALSSLPARQRRVLLLYALENWSYSQIAAAENSSVSSVKSLIFRARDQLRRACDKGLFALGFAPITRLRLRSRKHDGSFQFAVPGLVGNGILALQGLAPSVVGVALALTSLGVQITGPLPAPVAAAAAARYVGGRSTGRHLAAMPAAVPRANHVPEPTEVAIVTADRFLKDGTRNAKPDETRFEQFAASPSYDRDGTVFASGRVNCAQPTCNVLFVSRDRGASWQQLEAKNYKSQWLLLPPNYPTDSRIFNYGGYGLSVSSDGGKSFEQLWPLSIAAATISPEIANGGLRILMATGGGLFEYRDKSGMSPASYPIQPLSGPYVAYSPSFAVDRRVFFGMTRTDPAVFNPDGGFDATTITICRDEDCRQKNFGLGGPPQFRFSRSYVTDQTVVAFTNTEIYLASGSDLQWKLLSTLSAYRTITDVAVDGNNVLVAQTEFYDFRPSPLWISSDRGATWRHARISFKGYDQGISRLALLGSHNRILAAGATNGIACSVDDGVTWFRRCPADLAR